MGTKFDRTVGQARDPRRRQTGPEDLLWRRPRRNQLGVAFRRQHPIGPFIVDGCCIQARIVVELDGSIHYEDDVREQGEWRTAYLTRSGCGVLRFRNEQVQYQTAEVIQAIRDQIETTDTSQTWADE